MKLSQAILFLVIKLSVASHLDTSSSLLLHDAVYPVKQLPLDSENCDWLPKCYCRDESIYTNGSYHLLVNCTNAGLDAIPQNIPANTSVLNLNGNRITDVYPGAFKNLTGLKYLDLSENNITQLNNDSFEGLGNLLALSLSQNKIRYNNESIPFAVFKPLKKLKRLNLQQNFSFDDIEHDEAYPIEALSCLWGLEELLIDGLQVRSFSEKFAKMKRLQSLEFDGNNGRCSIKYVTLSMFEFCKNITNLKLIKCNIQSVQLGSFIELQNLNFLDISYNEGLLFKSLPNITFGLQKQKLLELRLIKIHRSLGECVVLNKDHVKFMRNMTIDKLFLDSNRLASLTMEAVDYIPRNIKGLSLKGNMILAGTYLYKVFAKGVFAHLKYINLSEQNINTDFLEAFRNNSVLPMSERKPLPKETVQKTETKLHENITQDVQTSCKNCNSVIFPFKLSADLMDIDLSDMRIRLELTAICICEPNSVFRLNLERNIFWSWQGPFRGLTQLLNLNLAWNSCEKISKNVFHDMGKLQTLNLSKNFLDNVLRNDYNGEIFRYQTNLQSLDLSDNKLTSLPPKIFKGLKHITKLYLSKNFLTTFNVDLSQMTGLAYLALSNNLLAKLSKGTMEALEKASKSDGLHTYINLSNNSLSCDCNDIDFVEWFSKNNSYFESIEEYRCKYENGSDLYLARASAIYTLLQTKCADYMAVILVSSLSLFLFLVVFTTAIIYRYRWDLRYFYYSAKLRYQGYMPVVDDENRGFEHDAFVSYCDDNRQFIKDVLVPELEEKRQMKLLVHDRDFIAGHFVNDNIMRAVTNARKTLIIMSTDFLKSKWCVYEMNMARMEAIKTGRNVLCVIMLEPVETSGLPLEMMDIIRQQTYLERPENRDFESIFWDRVHDSLMN